MKDFVANDRLLQRRADFPVLDQLVHGKPLVYLDNAATSQKPRAVIEALRHYYEHDNSNVHRGIHELSQRATEGYENARAKVAKFLGAAKAEEIVFTRGTTEAINLVAQTWGLENLQRGDVILLTEMEHHSNIVPWQLLARRTGAELKFVPVQEDYQLDVEAAEKLLGDRVKLFSFTHISNVLGAVNPVARLCQKARELGVVTLVDAAQSAGHRPVNVQELGCDFLAFSGHKACGPTGQGALYGRKELLEAMPPWQGGGEMISRVDFQESRWAEVPHKFEAGTPNIAGAIGLGVALDYLEEVGREAIRVHDEALCQYAWERMSQLEGVMLLGPSPEKADHAGVISFFLDDVHAHDVVTLADQSGIALRGGHHCAQPLMRKLGRPATARASFYFYNTTQEVDRLVEVLKEIRAYFLR